jgi:hypothetical protein
LQQGTGTLATGENTELRRLRRKSSINDDPIGQFQEIDTTPGNLAYTIQLAGPGSRKQAEGKRSAR